VIARGPTQHVFVVERSDTGSVDDGQTVRRRQVETGIRRDGWVEVSAGLEAGQRVVVAGLQGLRDGDRVRIESGDIEGGSGSDSDAPNGAGDP